MYNSVIKSVSRKEMCVCGSFDVVVVVDFTGYLSISIFGLLTQYIVVKLDLLSTSASHLCDAEWWLWLTRLVLMDCIHKTTIGGCLSNFQTIAD